MYNKGTPALDLSGQWTLRFREGSVQRSGSALSGPLVPSVLVLVCVSWVQVEVKVLSFLQTWAAGLAVPVCCL